MRDDRPSGRIALHAGLQARRPDIEATTLARVQSLSEIRATMGSAYLDEVRQAVSAAIEYGLQAIESGAERIRSTPPTLLAQARLAARTGVGLDTVMRSYVAGYAAFADFVMQEAADQALPLSVLHDIGRDQSFLLDRILAAVSEEHTAALADRLRSTADRRAERVRRLLNGEPLDTSCLNYDFAGHHLALVASGPNAPKVLRELAGLLDCRILLVPGGEEETWVWFGSSRQLDAEEVECLATDAPPDGLVLAIGEPGEGMVGWRISHRQAAAALPVGERTKDHLVRYAKVSVLASILQDDLATTSLRRLYLEPLEVERDGGETLRRTLRAYFAAERNVSSAAAAVGVSRRTVTNRLQVVEDKLGQSLGLIGDQLEVALRLDALQAG